MYIHQYQQFTTGVALVHHFSIKFCSKFFNQGLVEKIKSRSNLKMKTGSRLIRIGFSIAIMIAIKKKLARCNWIPDWHSDIRDAIAQNASLGFALRITVHETHAIPCVSGNETMAEWFKIILFDRDSNKMLNIHYLNTIFREEWYYLDRNLL
jgi:hypothetical protein